MKKIAIATFILGVVSPILGSVFQYYDLELGAFVDDALVYLLYIILPFFGLFSGLVGVIYSFRTKEKRLLMMTLFLVVLVYLGLVTLLISIGRGNMTGGDAAIKYNTYSLLSLSESPDFKLNGTIGITLRDCSKSGTIFTYNEAVQKIDMIKKISKEVICIADGNNWAIAARLKSDFDSWFCTDSRKINLVTKKILTSTSCPSSE
jgi:hypothetical protein